MNEQQEEPIDAHICSNGFMRGYPPLYCSMCRACNGLHVKILRKDMDRYNAMWAEQQAEIKRIKEGNFTPEEFHHLCHNLEKTVTREEFCKGCEAYQDKLFGPK